LRILASWEGKRGSSTEEISGISDQVSGGGKRSKVESKPKSEEKRRGDVGASEPTLRKRREGWGTLKYLGGRRDEEDLRERHPADIKFYLKYGEASFVAVFV